MRDGSGLDKTSTFLPQAPLIPESEIKYLDNFEMLGSSIARIIQLEFESLLLTARLRCCSSHLHLKVCPVLTCALTPAHLVKQNAQVVKT